MENRIFKLPLCAAAVFVLCQTATSGQPGKSRPALEIGIGASAMNYTRTYVSDFNRTADGRYVFDLKNKQVYGGAGISLACGVLDWLYADVQATVGLARYFEAGKDRQGWSFMAGPGVQLRPFLRSEWIQPYLRAGINWYTRTFRTSWFGTFEGDPTGEASWAAEDAWNKGRTTDERDCFPVSLGGGVVGWMGNRVGVRLQAEYLLPVSAAGTRFAQASAGLVFRFGGTDKRKAAADRYVGSHIPEYDGIYSARFPAVERIVEKRIEVPVEKIVEKEVRVEVPSEKTLAEMMDNVTFNFDEATLTPASLAVLDDVAATLGRFPDTRFLIAGHTDARGSDAYNDKLSRRRAEAVLEALLERGVGRERLVCHGFGKRAAIVPAGETDGIRRGDRKVVLERVVSEEVWNYLNR